MLVEVITKALLAAVFLGATCGILMHSKRRLIHIGCSLLCLSAAVLCLSVNTDLSDVVTDTKSRIGVVTDSGTYRGKYYAEVEDYSFITDNIIKSGSEVVLDVDYIFDTVYDVKLDGKSTISEIPLRDCNGITQSRMLRQLLLKEGV